MRPGALRRRLDHGDVGRMSNGNYMMLGLHGLDEPLLGNRDYDGRHSEVIMPLLMLSMLYCKKGEKEYCKR